MTAVKSNRLALLADLAALDWERPEVRATEHRTEDKRHGRLDGRLTALQLTRADDNRIAIRDASHVRRWPPACPAATGELS